MPNAAPRIQHALDALASAFAPLVRVPLLPGERQRMGGLLLPCGPALVRLVADALTDNEALFVDLPVSGAELAARQDEADAWRRLRGALLRAAEQAGDEYVRCQADAVKTAEAVLGHVTAERSLPGDRLRRSKLSRRHALAPAGLVLERYRRSLAPPRRPRAAPSGQRRRHAAALVDRIFARVLVDKYEKAQAGEEILARPLASPVRRAEEVHTPAPPAPTRTRRDPVDIQDRFVADVTGQPAAGPQVPAQPIDTQALRKLQGDVAETFADCPSPAFEEPLRKQLQGKRSPLWTQVMQLCADGLGARPDFARARGVSPAVCTGTVAQEAAVARVIKGAGDLHDAATAAAAGLSRDGRDRATRALQAATSAAPGAEGGGGDPGLQFAEAFRLYEVGDHGSGAALRRQGRLRPLREARKETEKETEELRLVSKFLSEFTGQGGGSHE